MPFLQLKLVSKIEIGQSSTCDFSHQGGSIGRSNDCDWTLLDVDRYISNKHVLISYQNEQFLITDVSSNGVLINNASTPLGKQNTQVLHQSDRIKIGSYEIEVENIQIVDSPQHFGNQLSQVEDDDLLGLVMGEDSNASNNHDNDFLNASQSDNFNRSSSFDVDDDGLGLSDILSGASNYKAPPAHSKPIPSFDSSPEKKPVLSEPETQSNNNQHYVANDSSIPEDWELSGILPAITDYEPPKANTQNTQAKDKEQSILLEKDKLVESVAHVPHVEDTASVKSISPVEPIPPVEAISPVPEIELIAPAPKMEPITAAEPIAPIESIAPVPKMEPITAAEPMAPVESIALAPKMEPITSAKPAEPSTSHTATASNVANSAPSLNQESGEQSTVSGSNEFLYTLYNKLGLPKEYLASINEDEFAEDIATVMLSTTKGLMSLLNSRTLFKQESRLSLTSVQPRSNNPIKFSIDPVDTLEMLLLKKKTGYLTAKESYEEAVNDIQLHQMAFLSGLQATLSGVLKQISPSMIEDKVNEKSRSFMGLKANAQYWQLYKEKQELLEKSVTENLNEVLSTYFSEAYQKQINNFKNDKK